MPPKTKFSKEEIIIKAVEIIVTKGYDKLTARELGAALNTSSRPIFTAFENMDDLKKSVFEYGMKIYHDYWNSNSEPNLFRRTGQSYIKFAQNEKALFQLIFMKSQNKPANFDDYMHTLDDHYSDTLGMIQKTYSLNKEDSNFLYKNMWIFCHGMATLCATNQACFTEEETNLLCDSQITALINQIKNR